MHQHDERLAAYVGGELDADETAALEADLARDPVLRARLAAIRRADDALRTLPDVEPRPGFEQRLRATLDAELETRLGDTAAGQASSGAVRELRSRRRLPDWLPAAAGAAAGVALFGAVGYGILQGADGGGDADAGGEVAITSDRGGADAGDMAPESAQAVEGPLVLATDRAYDEAGLAALAADPIVIESAERALDTEPREAVAGRFTAQLGLQADGFSAAEEGDGDAPTAAADEAPGAGAHAPGVTDDQLDVVRRCLAVLLDDTGAGGAAPIPTYAELARFGGEPVVVLGLVTSAPDAGAATRREVWVLDRADCQVRYFTQHD